MWVWNGGGGSGVDSAASRLRVCVQSRPEGKAPPASPRIRGSAPNGSIQVPWAFVSFHSLGERSAGIRRPAHDDGSVRG